MSELNFYLSQAIRLRFMQHKATYLLLTGFQGCTVSYGLHFSPLIYGPSAKRAGHIKIEGEKQGSVIYSTDQETRLVGYL